MAEKDPNDEKNNEYIISETSVENAVNSALSQFSEGEIVKNGKKPNFYTLKMFKKNIGGAILGKDDKRQIEGKYLQNTEENIKKITKLILDSARKYDPEKEPDPVPVIDPNDKDNKDNGDDGKTDQGDGNQPGQGDGNQPDKGDGNQPGQGDGNQPGQGDGNQPGQGDGNQPGQGDGNQPGQGDGNQPGQGDGNQPGQGDGNQPGQGDGNQPGQGDGNQPGQGDGNQPGQGDGNQPGQGETPKQSQEPKKEENKKRRLFIPIAAAALIGGAIGAAITSGANTIINENNNISIEYDSTENTMDALADLEQSSNDLIDENRNIADLIKGTNSDIREESTLLGKDFSEDERIESESTPINYLDEVEEIQAQRDSAIAKYSLIKEPTNEDKLEYTLQQLDVQSKSLNFKNEKLQMLLESKDIQSILIQEHSDAGYNKESHSKELKGNEALAQIYKENIQEVQNDIARNTQIQSHLKNLDLSQVQDFDEYFNAYFSGIQNSDVDKLNEFEQVFNNYNGYVKSYKADFKAEDFQRYMSAYTEETKQGQSVDEINKQFDKEINPNIFIDFFRE